MTMMPPPVTVQAVQQFADFDKKRNKFAPLMAIVVLHLAGFYAIQSGLLSKVVTAAMPTITTISIIAPPAPPKPPAPSVPKTVELSAPVPRAVIPPLPLIAVAPSEPTITPPQPTRAEAAPVATAAPTAPSTPSPTPPAPSTPRTVSSVEYIKAPQLIYPNLSRRLGESGTVVLRILINEKGLPEQILIQKSTGYNNLDEAGRQAAQRALFKPMIENGKPVPVYVLVPLTFQLS
ncbi:energy transducer TonB [Janthinobacterium lividum]|jgi:protein TonB|uniref:Energy transducer TonB n=1 Tax=Janthinobacterium lividum TaxID=29581 RepID=A0AAJ4T5A4_9BURK|nr:MULTISPECIES: energy transducer TonB [Janthinobacterium]KAB0327189.1 energy transducer TonB [Janthinobacterium lividum]MCC7695003.1 energy transducer TonB [Janthinobacterium sp. EB271-G4-7A]MDO8035636.1 energy transducer TonB [Janthinobacterium sp. SUN128]MDQ4626823.1 energy transducer TonB [Janthinobacterium lividum]MDQ4674210.1 energy transducer TonB [Janthinobacterium lividum]